MKYTFELSDEALFHLRKLDNRKAKRILNKLDSVTNRPFHFFERLTGKNVYRLRVGDYRIIAKIWSAEKKIFVITLGHRKNVYNK